MEPMVKQVIDSYPKSIGSAILGIRQTIFRVADQLEISAIEETLKWGEPSYLVKGGSTIRVAWKAKSPNNFALYFNCQTPLIETFKELYGDQLSFEGNRAIVFKVLEQVPTSALEHCISLALRYHKIKHLPLLGA